MGVLILAGTVTLVTLVVQRMSAAARDAARTQAPAARVNGSLGQPAGSRVAGLAGAGDRVALWVTRPDGERVLLLDPRTGAVAAELRLGE